MLLDNSSMKKQASLVEAELLAFLQRYNCLNKEKIALAVSGGADSLALLYAFVKLNLKNTQVHVITINHGLREEAKDEAKYVASLCQKWGCLHKVLSPISKLKYGVSQREAREARLKTIENYCIVNGIDRVFFAHHSNDQIETRVQRLLKKSSLFGMAGISTLSKHDCCYFYRPFLTLTKQDLIDYLTENSINWCEDKSNKNLKYQRNFIRRCIEDERLLDTELNQILANDKLGIIKEKIYGYVTNWLRNNVSFSSLGYVLINDKQFLRYPKLMQLLSLRIIFQYYGKYGYMANFNDIERQIAFLKDGKKINFHGMNIEMLSSGAIFLQKECRNLKPICLNSQPYNYLVYNGSYLISWQNLAADSYYISPLQSLTNIVKTENINDELQELQKLSRSPKRSYLRQMPIICKNEQIYLYLNDKNTTNNKGITVSFNKIDYAL